MQYLGLYRAVSEGDRRKKNNRREKEYPHTSDRLIMLYGVFGLFFATQKEITSQPH